MDKIEIAAYVGGVALILWQSKDKILAFVKKHNPIKNGGTTNVIVPGEESELIQKVKLYEDLMELAKDEDTKTKLNEMFPLLNKEYQNAKN